MQVEEYKDRSQFWQALDKPGIRAMMTAICGERDNVVVFGEIFGSGVQDMTYGLSQGQWDFRVFDVAVNGKYLAYDEKSDWCKRHGVATVPVLYDGPYSKAKMEEVVAGPTTICDSAVAGGFKGREGVVIMAKREQSVAAEKMVFDRMALKAINFDYLERKGGTEFH